MKIPCVALSFCQSHQDCVVVFSLCRFVFHFGEMKHLFHLDEPAVTGKLVCVCVCVCAVSYTHLDVYKRQAYPSCHFSINRN